MTDTNAQPLSLSTVLEMIEQMTERRDPWYLQPMMYLLNTPPLSDPEM